MLSFVYYSKLSEIDVISEVLIYEMCLSLVCFKRTN